MKFIFKFLFFLVALGIHFARRAIAALLDSKAAKIVGCMLRPAMTLAKLEASHLECTDKQHDLDAADAKLEALEQALQAAQIERDAANINAELLGAEGAELESECAAIFAERDGLLAMAKAIDTERDNAVAGLAETNEYVAWAEDRVAGKLMPPPEPQESLATLLGLSAETAVLGRRPFYEAVAEAAAAGEIQNVDDSLFVDATMYFTYLDSLRDRAVQLGHDPCIGEAEAEFV
ncbi:hypothetical protein IWW51_001578 [Coemansia sp. RSA 2702]|nr:hypothetical protein IWW51_001578 [Coemansia sp. RSA 2702]